MLTQGKLIPTESPKILIFDIETSPLEALSWGPKWKTNLIKVTQPSRVMCFSAKWFGGKQVTAGWPDYPGYVAGEKDDREIVKDIWMLIDAADIIVAHNGRSFDLRTMNSRFIAHGLPLPSPYKLVDTKVQVKKVVRLPSNSLEDIGDYYGLGHKLPHQGFKLWEDCLAGDPEAWKTMKAYNHNDVSLLEKIYVTFRPWMAHPNMALYDKDGSVCCTTCGSHNYIKSKLRENLTTLSRQYKCKDCGHYFSETRSLVRAPVK